ncbi:MAG TPA: anti-sigma factor antagonist [Bacteroidetes bacterium]|nr:anti-sigma factor antagonist [Bacteroidota bacterium]
MLKIVRTDEGFHVTFLKIRRLNTVISAIIEKQLMQLLETPGTTLILSLEGIRFIDSSGFDTLLKLDRAARAHHGRFVIDRIAPEVTELLHLVGLQNHFKVAGRPVREETH